MVIFQIHVADFALRNIDTKRKAAVPGNAQTPCAFAVSREGVNFPCRKRPQFLQVAHVFKEGEHLAQLVRGILWDALRAVLRVEPLQSFMDEVSYLHP